MRKFLTSKKIQEVETSRSGSTIVLRVLFPLKTSISLAPKEYIKKNGDIIELTHKPIYQDEKVKKLDKIICIATDITHKKSLEEKAFLEKEKAKCSFLL